MNDDDTSSFNDRKKSISICYVVIEGFVIALKKLRSVLYQMKASTANRNFNLC